MNIEQYESLSNFIGNQYIKRRTFAQIKAVYPVRIQYNCDYINELLVILQTEEGDIVIHDENTEIPPFAVNHSIRCALCISHCSQYKKLSLPRKTRISNNQDDVDLYSNNLIGFIEEISDWNCVIRVGQSYFYFNNSIFKKTLETGDFLEFKSARIGINRFNWIIKKEEVVPLPLFTLLYKSDGELYEFDKHGSEILVTGNDEEE